MPQASDEQREKMREYFGDSIDDAGPTAFLEAQGFVQNGTGWWTHPTREFRTFTAKECDCLYFLADEWDHGFDFSPPQTPSSPSYGPGSVSTRAKTMAKTIKQAKADIGTLLDMIDYLCEALGEALDAEDLALYTQIKAEWCTEGKR